MPSFSATSGSVRLAGGTATFIPPRFSADRARLHLVAGDTSFSIITAAETPRIERLRRFEPKMIDASGETSLRHQVVQQRNAEGIEKAFEAQQAQIVALEQSFNLALKALAQATSVDNRSSIATSYINPTKVLSASNTGTITVAAHSRIYGNGDEVTVNSGAVSNYSSGQVVTVFYRDAARAGGAVTYEGSLNAVAQSGNIHVVGTATIPAPGDPPTSGTSPVAPGVPPPADDDPGAGYDLE